MLERDRLRNRMVDTQIAGRGIRDSHVLDAMRSVPREAFVDPPYKAFAYDDAPLPIGEKQTISQPYIVAMMIEAAEIDKGDRVLEVGSGSGYAAAVLSLIVSEVFAIERDAALADTARRRLADLSYNNIHVRSGDGSLGWPEAQPFDAILVAASSPRVPPALKEQLAVSGHLIIPVGKTERRQALLKITRTSENEFVEVDLGPVSFVPLMGAGGWGEKSLETD
ncbi:protein-L-isoaspartate(D-aspartate) O-methyltransferase [Hyphomicrobium sp.]|jgi:protein-L-isoaspartate(D-aspartate) O-methyltransferase|uniref:protein-L-isoaspartate(D-aspartate) O-methyltransferase n=1 Tax=Hyphomicrobium sp. TaxID=82 RepID=UPI002BDBC0BC|nr:protein-L-isoaspartate(D-aspartate) O-methyltransferase [Hyphomicrobium sp.]HVZ03329.1 protein-L-isoaspartate(D-aspartate) O-methyltransferase [Hyphomicrobium sp.]